MALSIVTSANINDSTSSYDVTLSGKLLSNARVNLDLKVRGVIVASTYTYGTNAYFTGVTAAEIYANAAGQSLAGAVEIVAVELNIEEDTPTQSASKIGNITLNYRMSLTLTTPTTSNKINLDIADPTNIAGSWSRVTTDFVGQIVVQVGNKGDGTSTSWTTVYTSSNLTTSVNVDVKTAGIDDEIIAAMASASPKDIRVLLYTRFRTGSSSYTTLGYGTPRTVAGAFEKVFFQGSTVAINPFTIDANLVSNDLPFTLTTYVSGATHALKLYVNAVLIKTITGITASGSFAIDSADLSSMLSVTDQVTTCNAYIECVTTYLGVDETTSSPSVIATVGAGYVPSITAQSHSENTTSPAVATLIGKYVKSISTLKFLLSGNTTGTGTRIKQIRAVVGGQTITVDYTYASNTTSITNAQLISAVLAVFGTGLVATVSITDFRNRTTTYTWNNLEVLDYNFPKINSLDVVRANSDGSVNGVGVFMNVVINASVQSLINSTEKNELYYRIGYKVKGAGSYTYYSAVDTNALSVDATLTKGTAVTQEFARDTVYEIIVEVYDVLTSGSKTLGADTLPYGQVTQMWGRLFTSLGKLFGGIGILDVGKDDDDISINADGHIQTSKQLKSTIATGTSPLDVLSTTLNTNFNADMLDGYHVGGNTNNIPVITTGTFIPTLIRSTTNPTLTYSVQSGFYYKVGNLVFMTVMITANITASGSGNWRIAGFPFNVKNSANYIATLSTGLSFSGCDGGYFLKGGNSPFLTANGVVLTANPTGTVNLYVSTMFEID